MKQLIIMLSLVLFTTSSFAQNNKKVQEITIHSSTQCEMCENKLTSMFAEYSAVKAVEYDTENQNIMVTYNSKKTTPDEIREKITEEGYDADDKPAKIKAYMALPECCKKGAHIPEKPEK